MCVQQKTKRRKVIELVTLYVELSSKTHHSMKEEKEVWK
jgi:hypothetical protein